MKGKDMRQTAISNASGASNKSFAMMEIDKINRGMS